MADNMDFDQLGGHPLTLNDGKFLQNAWQEQFRALCLGLAELSDVSFKLSGANAYTSSGTWWISEGYVVIQIFGFPIIFYVPAHDTGIADSVAESDLYWKGVTTTVDPSPVQYRNSGPKEVHKRTTLTMVTSGGLSIKYQDTVKQFDIVERRLEASASFVNNMGDLLGETTVYTVGAGGGAVAYNANATGTLIYWKDKLGYVHVLGHAERTNNAQNGIITTLPVGYRPPIEIEMPSSMLVGGSSAYSVNSSLIRTNGEIQVANPVNVSKSFFTVPPYLPA